MCLVKAMLLLCIIAVLLPHSAVTAAATDQPGASAPEAADQTAEAWVAAVRHKQHQGKHGTHTGHHGHHHHAGPMYPGAGDPFYPQNPEQPSPALPRRPGYTPTGHEYAGHENEDEYRYAYDEEPSEPYYPEADPWEQQYDQDPEDGPEGYYTPSDGPDYRPGGSSVPHDSDYYRSYPHDPNAGEPGTHQFHNKPPVVLNGPQKCDFQHGEQLEICLQEVSRTPAGLVVSPEVSYNPTTEFT